MLNFTLLVNALSLAIEFWSISALPLFTRIASVMACKLYVTYHCWSLMCYCFISARSCPIINATCCPLMRTGRATAIHREPTRGMTDVGQRQVIATGITLEERAVVIIISSSATAAIGARTTALSSSSRIAVSSLRRLPACQIASSTILLELRKAWWPCKGCRPSSRGAGAEALFVSKANDAPAFQSHDHLLATVQHSRKVPRRAAATHAPRASCVVAPSRRAVSVNIATARRQRRNKATRRRSAVLKERRLPRMAPPPPPQQTVLRAATHIFEWCGMPAGACSHVRSFSSSSRQGRNRIVKCQMFLQSGPLGCPIPGATFPGGSTSLTTRPRQPTSPRCRHSLPQITIG